MDERAFRVHGRVQGVGFRWWACAQARRLGITGNVRNLEDGSVEVRARGSTWAVLELRRLLGSGPPGAEVSEVRETEAAAVPTDGFLILR